MIRLIQIISVFALVCLMSATVLAQDNEQLSKIHLPNNNFYTGVIIEKVDSKYVDIISLGGEEIRISFDKIIRIEAVEGTPSAAIYRYLARRARERKQRIKGEKKQYFTNGTKYEGYFALIQYVTGYAHMGVTSVHGYKFNQFAHLGMGAGFDGVQRPISFGPKRFSEKLDNALGMHIPLFVFLGGEVLKTRTTPYYALELGYAYVIPMNSLIDLETREISPHGLSAAFSFGAKFNTHRNYHTNVGLKTTFRARQMTFRELRLDSESSLYHIEFNKVWTSGWFLGLTVVQGF